MNYYTSDLHFFHNSIIRFCNRPFKDMDDMFVKLRENWNKKVNEQDTVYILGDYALNGTKTQINRLMNYTKTLNGRKILILGNHDWSWKRHIENLEDVFEEVCQYKKITDEGEEVCLFHFPIEEWDHKNFGSYHLYGHVHQFKTSYIPNRYHVGVDTNNYEPVTLKELKEKYGKLYDRNDTNSLKNSL